MVSYHKTFDYFLARFGLKTSGYIEERPGIPPAPASVARLIGRIRNDNVKAVFHEQYFDREMSALVGRKIGATVLVLPTSVGGEDNITNYEQLIDRLVTAFVATMKLKTTKSK